MQVVSDDGLHYFYDKISQKFVSSINGEHPDPSTGDITINNFKATEGLVTAPGQFDRRFTAGGAGVAGPSSTAYITRLEGALELVGQVDEELRIIDEYDLLTSINKQTFINVISSAATSAGLDSATGTYIISASADFPNSNFSIASVLPSSGLTPASGGGSSWSTTYSSWFINDSAISVLYDYGLEINSEPMIAGQGYSKSIMNAPHEDASWDVLVNPSTWAATISKPGVYDFYQFSTVSAQPQIELYAINGEISRGSNASYYGLTINSAPAKSGGKTVPALYFRVTYTGIPNPEIDIEYVAPSAGQFETAKPINIISTSFNQFNTDNKKANLSFITDTLTGVNTIKSNSGKYLCYCNAYKEFSDGYVAYHSGGQIENIMWAPSIPSAAEQSFAGDYGTAIKDSTLSEVTFSEDGYIVVALSSNGYNDLCIHPKTPSRSINTTYKSYETNINIPINNIPQKGLAAVGDVRDVFEIIGNDYVYTSNIQVIPSSDAAYQSALDSAIANNEPYECDGQNLYIINKVPSTTTGSYTGNPSYAVQPYGIEQLIYDGARPYYSATYAQDLSTKLQFNTLTRDAQSPALTKAEINGLRHSFIDIIYPVGSIYMSTNDISPEELWGGRWERISDKFLIGASENGIDMPYYLGTIGGEAAHMLSEDELPNVNIQFTTHAYKSGNPLLYNEDTHIRMQDAANASSLDSSGNKPATAYTITFGADKAHNNIPPYLAVCIWKRIA